MKREIKIVPLILSVLGLVSVGFCLGSLAQEVQNTQLVIGVVFGFIAFTFILLMSVGFPMTKEDKENTKIVW